MKIIGVSLLLFGSVVALSIGIDLFQGTNILQALYNALSPFRVMEVAELFVLFSLLFFFFAESLYLFLKKRQQKQQ
ncbi:hypothetical protein C1N83_23060 [Priestia aryabhattai]|uniref:hypothetical protein n=1 Tax=Priestia TaxID=2800373 RepID=UPI00064EE916|nr:MULTISPECIES: hypothetical protein [Priestia]KML27211.1 hypothetical protein VL11_19775 [Priestia aryabhattai]KMN98792.1 hypothetical protein ABV89_15410 [Priestia aryabhattai]MBY0006981.1 hypothetical protein [Priestia aryabhattai]MBY0048485.1 hypothetical protein [Priestia aryabhattai]MDE8674142.1 hypothetical protein [Priestia aryabhattai]